jgi:hypothetical protein
MNLLLTLWAAYRAYKIAEKSGTSYVVLCSHGVPQVAVFVGLGRDAWRVSQRAVQEFELKR